MLEYPHCLLPLPQHFGGSYCTFTTLHLINNNNYWLICRVYAASYLIIDDDDKHSPYRIEDIQYMHVNICTFTFNTKVSYIYLQKITYKIRIFCLYSYTSVSHLALLLWLVLRTRRVFVKLLFGAAGGCNCCKARARVCEWPADTPEPPEEESRRGGRGDRKKWRERRGRKKTKKQSQKHAGLVLFQPLRQPGLFNRLPAPVPDTTAAARRWSTPESLRNGTASGFNACAVPHQ